MSNSDTVKSIYAAFGRGDVPAILERLADDVEWEYGAAPNDVPWLQPRRGRAAVPGFFEALGQVEIHRFEVNHVLGDGPVVVGLISIDFTVKKTGRRVVETDEAHVWTFDAAGRVRRFRHAADTHAHALAWRG